MKKLLLITMILLSTLNANTQRENVEAFVERFYNTILSRHSDAGGLKHWSDALIANEKAGEDIAKGFIFSPEFVGSKTTDSEYLVVLYRSFFDREGDAGGVAFWLDKLEGQMSREQVLYGFLNSNEFRAIAKKYGIIPVFTAEALLEIKKTKITGFIEGLYLNVLERNADAGGLAHWTNGLATIQTSGEMVLTGFILSPEFIGRNTSDAEFIEILYHTFFHRNGDTGGVAHWLKQLNNNQSREQVLLGFVHSPEFHDTAEEYGFYATTAEALKDKNNRIPVASGGNGDDGFVLDLSDLVDNTPDGDDGIDPSVNMG